MSALALEPLQKAVYQALTGDVTLMTLISGVYDHVPEDSVLPYLAFGQSASRDVSNNSDAAERVRLELLAYSRSGGRKQALDMLERVHAVLHHQEPSPSGGWRIVSLQVESAAAELLRDGMTWRGTVWISALLETA